MFDWIHRVADYFKNNLLAILILLLVIFLIIFLRKFYYWIFPPEESPIDMETNGATLTDAEAKDLADILFEAMNDIGTDTDKIDMVYDKVKDNLANLGKVNNAFGRRKYAVWGNFFGLADLFGKSYSLRVWLNLEESGKALQKWNELYNLACLTVNTGLLGGSASYGFI